MREIICFLLAISSFFPINVMAGDAVKGDFSELKITGIARVENVVDPFTLILDNGKILRLSGLDIPDFNPRNPGDFALKTKEKLSNMLTDNKIKIYQTMNSKLGRTNRMGHELAHIVIEDSGKWIQGYLLEEGLARVRTTARNPDMASQMYETEVKARRNNKGIWGHTGFPVLNKDSAKEYTDSFQIVEGTIHKAAIVRNTIYLNFEEDWRKDFTIGIKAATRRDFSKEGLDPLSWKGKHVRARGWLRSWNGPYMEIDHPQAVEIIGEKGSQPDKSSQEKLTEIHQ